MISASYPRASTRKTEVGVPGPTKNLGPAKKDGTPTSGFRVDAQGKLADIGPFEK
jgi:hypothetical protein